MPLLSNWNTPEPLIAKLKGLVLSVIVPWAKLCVAPGTEIFECMDDAADASV